MFDILSRKFAPAQESNTAILTAISKSHAMIEFSPQGKILSANAMFLKTMGYELGEIVGMHHSVFVDADYAKSDAYSSFWQALSRGEAQTASFKRHTKGGSTVWLHASYIPIMASSGHVEKIVKIASNETESYASNIDSSGKVKAIDLSQAVIEFEPDGTIITANQNFLAAMGYSLSEIRGQHHHLFVSVAESQSADYQAFWRTLQAGRHVTLECQRIRKNGADIWLQATYTPITDDTGTVTKVVKFATDITTEKLKNAEMAGKMAALDRAQAVIEFKLDGTILTANQNFLSAVGYRLDEIKGHHHSLFVCDQEKASQAYRDFWAKLADGTFQSGEFKRIAKDGGEVWLQATYNPIIGPDGKPFKVVKFASDITEMVRKRDERTRIGAIVDGNLAQILTTISEVNSRASSAATASNQTEAMVQTVASGAEELNASLHEIAESVSMARTAVEKTFSETQAANTATSSLNDAAEAMSSIVTLIEDIAEQINLLALNATIEAARAGDAGRGFAVVASEVKSLATQVASAINQISSEIGRMQDVSGDVVLRLGAINTAVGDLQGSVTGIAGAIEEQSTVTREISANMQTAACAVAEINQNLNELSVGTNTATDYTREGIELYRSVSD